MLITCGGMIIGGCVVTKKKLSPLACIRMLLVVMTGLAFISITGFFLSCGNAQIVGFNDNGLLVFIRLVKRNVLLRYMNGDSFFNNYFVYNLAIKIVKQSRHILDILYITTRSRPISIEANIKGCTGSNICCL